MTLWVYASMYLSGKLLHTLLLLTGRLITMFSASEVDQRYKEMMQNMTTVQEIIAYQDNKVHKVQ